MNTNPDVKPGLKRNLKMDVKPDVNENRAKVNADNFQYCFDRQDYREMIYRDGTYFLRTNQSGKDGTELWQQYMLQCNVEQAFKELKSDLGIRPVYHRKEDRVDAHIFEAFLSYCLQATLRQKLRGSALGLTSQAVLETLSRIQMIDVSFPTQDGDCSKCSDIQSYSRNMN